MIDFDRQALKRSDKAWISKQLANESSVFLLFWNNKFLVTDDFTICFLDKSTAEHFCKTQIQWKFLGVRSGDNDRTPPTVTVFGAEVIDATDRVEDANWQSLRVISLHLSSQEANLLVYTQGLLKWHSKNHYCSNCGSFVYPELGGHSLICSNDNCANEIFPRTDPAMIVLVYNKDKCLLGRKNNWPENMYSCLAGFIETGEDIESAVRREVFEESGLLLNDVEYKGSQPWPFPQSLMLGFHAEARNRELAFHDEEIHEALWFSRQQLIDSVVNKQLELPSSVSISYHLIEDWFNQQSDIPLSRYTNR